MSPNKNDFDIIMFVFVLTSSEKVVIDGCRCRDTDLNLRFDVI